LPNCFVENYNINKESERMVLEQPIEYVGRGWFNPSWVKMGDYLHEIIEERGPITRSELMDMTGIPWTTLFDSLVKLLDAKKIQKFSMTRMEFYRLKNLEIIGDMRGRPKTYYEVKNDGNG